MGTSNSWPSNDWAWVAIAEPAKAFVKVALSVGATGSVAVTFSPDTLREIGWSAGLTLDLHIVEEAERVFLRFRPSPEGVFTLQEPSRKPKDGEARCFVRIGKRGGLNLAPRAAEAVEHKAGEGQVVLLVSRTPAQTLKPRAGKGDKAKPAGSSVVGGLDFDTTVAFARGAAVEAWPTKIDRDDARARVAAAVALVKFGFARDAVRKAFNLGSTILPEIEDMPRPAREVAATVFKALQEVEE